MSHTFISRKQQVIDTFHVQGERFVVIKKQYLDELTALTQSVLKGEYLLKSGKTRSFDDFLKSIRRKKT